MEEGRTEMFLKKEIKEVKTDEKERIKWKYTRIRHYCHDYLFLMAQSSGCDT